MKPTLFLSDLHLAAERPGPASAFHMFCAGPARGARAVYILGDLYDSWVGDDQLADRFAAKVASSLAAVAKSGVLVFVARGNRDFLLGERFSAATGTSLLPEQLSIDLAGVPTLVSHGDELCTADADYQRFRRRMRNPATQRRLLSFPYWTRRLLAGWLRRKSRRATSLKAEAILDADEQTVVQTFRRTGVVRMIHGHTHRPATHHLTVDGVPRERIVLPAWHTHGHFLEVDGSRFTPHEIVER